MLGKAQSQPDPPGQAGTQVIVASKDITLTEQNLTRTQFVMGTNMVNVAVLVEHLL